MVMPLEGIRVLDWTVWQSGPMATWALGELGAEVIKIESKAGGDPARGMDIVRGGSALLRGGRNATFEYCNCNKKSIALDLSKETARDIIYELVRKSDVFVQNFRVGVAKKLRLDYESLRQHNEKLIYASVSLLGPKGAENQEPGYDYLGGARSGFMAAIAQPGMPPQRLGGGLVDHITGTVLISGILAALLARERLGMGQEVDVSLLGSMIWAQAMNVSIALMAGFEQPEQARDAAPNPLWNHYACKDGKYIALACIQPDRYWASFCKALGTEYLKDDPRFADRHGRQRNCKELISILDAIFMTKVCAEWVKILRETGDIVCSPVKTISELKDDPQVIANDYIVDFEHPVLGKVKEVGFPIKLNRTPAQRRSEAPELGQHTEEILIDIAGYTWAEIEQLAEEGVI